MIKDFINLFFLLFYFIDNMSQDSLINDEQDNNKNIQLSSSPTTASHLKMTRQLKSTINGKLHKKEK